MGHPFWPERVLLLRDAALVFFEISACAFLACAAVAETARFRALAENRAFAPTPGTPKRDPDGG
jgi:hypothetical protein